MVVIRLSRSGAKKRPFFNIVVTESRHRRDGRRRLGLQRKLKFECKRLVCKLVRSVTLFMPASGFSLKRRWRA